MHLDLLVVRRVNALPVSGDLSYPVKLLNSGQPNLQAFITYEHADK